MPNMNQPPKGSPELAKALDTIRKLDLKSPIQPPPADAGGPVQQESDPPQAEQPPSSPDEVWRAGLRPEMRPVAERHGRTLFCFCANIGIFSGGMQKLAAAGQATGQTLVNLHARKAAASMGQALGAAHAQLLQGFNGLVELTILGHGWSQAQVVECQTDIKRAAELVQMQPGRSASGIILPPH